MNKINWMTPAVTLFKQDGSLDTAANQALYEHLIAGGVNGIVVMGSSGEFVSLSMEEKQELIRIAAQTIAGRVRFLVGTSCMDYRETIALSNYALDQGADGVMIVPPYYFALNDACVESYFDRVAEAVHGNIFLYNFPDRTGYDVTPQAVLHLVRRHPNIVGYKDTVVEMCHTRELIKTMRSEFPAFEILSGYDDNFAHNILSGGNGNIGALSNLLPELTCAMVKAAREGNMDKVTEYQRSIDQWMDIYGISSNFIGVIKRALQLRGLPVEAVCRVPFVPLSEGEDQALIALMKKMEII